MTFIPTVKAANVVAIYPFNEGSGSTAYDYSGNANNGTITGASYTKVQDGGYAMSFDGINQDVINTGITDNEIGGSSGDQPFSVSIWVYFTGTGQNNEACLFSSYSGNPDSQYFHINKDSSGFIRFIIYGSSSNNVLYSNNSVSIGEWYHIVATYDGSSEMNLYVNNNITTSTGLSLGDWTDGDSILIGRRNRVSTDNQLLDGKIRLPTILDTALTADEVEQLYRQTYIN